MTPDQIDLLSFSILVAIAVFFTLRQHYREKNEKHEFEIPKFPLTFEEILQNPARLDHLEKEYSKVVMVHIASGNPDSSSIKYIFDIMLYDTEGTLYDFERGYSEKKMEQKAQRLAKELAIPFERKYTA